LLCFVFVSFHYGCVFTYPYNFLLSNIIIQIFIYPECAYCFSHCMWYQVLYQQICIILFQLWTEILQLCGLVQIYSNPHHCKWETSTVLSVWRGTAGKNLCCVTWELNVDRNPVSSVHIVTGDSNTNTTSHPIFLSYTERIICK
jgi:hypothetical protein